MSVASMRKGTRRRTTAITTESLDGCIRHVSSRSITCGLDTSWPVAAGPVSSGRTSVVVGIDTLLLARSWGAFNALPGSRATLPESAEATGSDTLGLRRVGCHPTPPCREHAVGGLVHWA